MTLALALLGAYLLGAIPFSYLVARRFGVADVRKVGSGNVGATNVMRSAGKTAGLIAFVLDASKGAVAALFAGRLSGPGWLPAVAALLAVLGHMYPVWLGFRGGKGVATGAGAFLPLVPQATFGALIVFVLALALLRYVSLASILSALSLALLAWVLHAAPATAWCVTLCAALIVAKHHGNLGRIWNGTENRLGRKPA
jgi:glycerol-3-phosphate acyltransferase PlsY